MYSPDFKVAAIKAYHEGQTAIEIFLKAGFNMDIIGHEKPKKMLLILRKVYAICGEAGLLEERRGRTSIGRRTAGALTTEDKLKRAEARIKLLEAENDMLKSSKGKVVTC